MSGSMFWQDYNADNNITYAVYCDKSNGLALCATLQLMITRTSNNPPIPKTIKQRYANAYLQSNPVIKRRFPMGNKAAFAAAQAPGATIVSTEGTWIITSTRGEKSRTVPPFGAADTGQVA